LGVKVTFGCPSRKDRSSISNPYRLGIIDGLTCWTITTFEGTSAVSRIGLVSLMNQGGKWPKGVSSYEPAHSTQWPSQDFYPPLSPPHTISRQSTLYPAVT
jgi:hypothetical protein